MEPSLCWCLNSALPVATFDESCDPVVAPRGIEPALCTARLRFELPVGELLSDAKQRTNLLESPISQESLALEAAVVRYHV
jgi:hypothetical protein